MTEEELIALYRRGAHKKAAEERERNRLLVKDEIEARLTVCRSCGHMKGDDGLRVVCNAPCRTCRRREDGTVLRAVTLAREKCPLDRWDCPKISICINTHNEGPRVRATVAAIRENLGDWPHELIVVADEVTDGGCDDLGADVTVIWNKERRGCAQCKLQAIEAATGDVLVFLDAHHSVIAGRLSDLGLRAWQDEAVFTPVVRNIKYDEQWNPHPANTHNQVPCDTGMRFEKQQYVLKPNSWVRKHHLKDIRMVGVGFAVSRRTLDRIGGLNAYRGIHGSQERGIALRAFMAGVPVRLFAECVLGHEFRAGRPRPAGYKRYSVKDQSRNFWHAYFVVAGDYAFEKLRPRLGKAARKGDGVIDVPEVKAERERFQRLHKKRSDAELLEFLQIESPSPAARVVESSVVQPKIDVRIAYEPGARIGGDYNRIMRETPHEWVLFLDHDVLLLHPSWYEVCQRAIRDHPDGGLFTCYTNNIGCKHQKAPGAPAGDSIRAHRTHARKLWEENGYMCTENRTHLIGGMFMLTSRAAWRASGGFPEDGFFGVDNWYHRQVMQASLKCYRMDGLYCFHLRDRKGDQWIADVDTSATLARQHPRPIAKPIPPRAPSPRRATIRTERRCIYTVITGGFDPVPPSRTYEGWDYLCFTDNSRDCGTVVEPWQLRVFDSAGLGPREASRLPKILAHRYLADHGYSIYHDANMRLVADPTELCEELAWPDFAVPNHRYTDCPYGEASLMIKGKKAPEGAIRAAADRYRAEGLPEGMGATENGCMLRRHNDPRLRRLMELWWEEFIALGLGRDQMPFAYARWKLSYDPVIFSAKVRRKYLWGTHLHRTRAA